ncbi:MAG TPA: molecular chaperone DnaJ [Bacteroidales bacterium]|nr:molecular chaperone DnaJ [Bacteroidales bacterium]
MSYVRWISGGLGFALFGPIGGILGFALGSLFDTPSENGGAREIYRNDFTASLMVLIAVIIKADNKILKSELNFVKRFLVQNYGEARSKEMLLLLRDLTKKQINLTEVTSQIRENMNYSSRIELINFLFNLANADNYLHPKELSIIHQIAKDFLISERDFISIKSMYIDDSDAPYKILGISPDASNDEVKKAYRRMAMKFHPDKVSFLNEKMKKTAEEKFKKVNEAYREIKKRRGIK